jgi:hypothetical protein
MQNEAAMRRFWIALLGIAASSISVTLIANQLRSVIDVFELTDPSGSTGLIGMYFYVGGLAEYSAVILVTICVLLPGAQANFRLGFAAMAVLPPLLEIAVAAPCFYSARPGALCGVGFVVVSYGSIPIVILATIGFVATSRLRSVKVAGVAVAAAFLGCAGAAQALLAPSEPDQCRRFAEVTKRSNCLKAFADRRRDENICRSIEFRTTRFTCLQEIAVDKQQPLLCDEITDTGPLAAYEAPAVSYRDTCFQNLAYAMHDRAQCARVADAHLRASCEAHNP